jgi:hypothetical protein
MKLLVKLESGPSPGVIIAGEREDLRILAEQLKTGVESQDKGTIYLKDAHVQGEPHGWIAFEIAKNFSLARDDQKVRAAPTKIALIVLLVIIAAICYLAYRGLRTF